MFIDYHRLPDTDEAMKPAGAPMAVNAPLTLACWNLGFGAYSDDYGFIVSDNVKVISCGVIDEGFKCSDHNPVIMEFELTEE